MIGSGGGYSDAVGDALGGNVDGGASTAGQGHPGNRGRGRGGPRGGPRGYDAPGYSNDPFGEFGFFGQPNTVGPNVDNFAGIGQGTRGRDSAYGANAEAERGLAQAMANAMAARGRDRGYRAGNPHTDTLNPDVARATGFVPGHALLDRYGHPVTLDNLSFTRDDLLEDENYKAWAQKNPDKVRNMPGMLGGLLNSMGLHDLSGAMTPEEVAFDDSRWGDPSMGAGGTSPAGGEPRQGIPRHGPAGMSGTMGNWVGAIGNDVLRQFKHAQALQQEGGDNYDGRYERRNPRAYDEEARWDAQGGFGGGV